MTTGNGTSLSVAERRTRQEQIASRALIRDYLETALEISDPDGMEESNPQIVAALIVAQSIDRLSEVFAYEARVNFDSLERNLVAALESRP